jgi:hypothetical protein
MIEGYRAGSTSSTSSMGRGNGPQRSYSSSRFSYSDYDDHRSNFSDNMDDDFRGSSAGQWRGSSGDHQRTSGFVSDTTVSLIGALVGGALGYFLPMMMSSDRSHSSRGSSYGTRGSGYGQAYDASRSSSSVRSTSHSVEMDETTEMIASDKVEGTKVYNHAGEPLGEVYNFMVGKRSGRVAYAVMSFGGFLGIGQRYHALPWNVLTYDTSKGGYVISTTKDQLMSAPHFAAGEEPFARTEDMRRIRQFWAEGQLSL